MKRFYLAYGSNLNIRQMSVRCPSARVVGTAEIRDYELLFKGSKTGAYLTIEPKKGSSVPVAVWDVTANDEERLDAYEGFPNFYYKAEFRVPVKYIGSGRVFSRQAFVYIMHEERHIEVPSRRYVDTCIKGYRDFGFDTTPLKLAYANSKKGVLS